MGLDESAERIIKSEPLQLDERILLRMEESVDDNHSALGIDPFGNTVLMETAVFHDLNTSKKPKRPSTEKKRSKKPCAKPREMTLIMLNDSVIDYPNPELLGAKPD